MFVLYYSPPSSLDGSLHRVLAFKCVTDYKFDSNIGQKSLLEWIHRCQKSNNLSPSSSDYPQHYSMVTIPRDKYCNVPRKAEESSQALVMAVVVVMMMMRESLDGVGKETEVVINMTTENILTTVTI